MAAFARDVVVAEAGFRPDQVVLLGSVLPAIRNNTESGHALRKHVDASQATRTAKTLAFNELLRRTCAEEGYGWVDISSDILGGDGVVAEQFVRTDRDNHLDSEATYELWIRKLSVDKIGRATRTLSRRATAQSHDDGAAANGDDEIGGDSDAEEGEEEDEGGD